MTHYVKLMAMCNLSVILWICFHIVAPTTYVIYIIENAFLLYSRKLFQRILPYNGFL